MIHSTRRALKRKSRISQSSGPTPTPNYRAQINDIISQANRSVQLCKFDKAEELYLQAIEFARVHYLQQDYELEITRNLCTYVYERDGNIDAKAAPYYEKYANMGNADFMIKLARYYVQQYDLPKARQWYNKLYYADVGHKATALCGLADCAEHDESDDDGIDEAVIYYSRALEYSSVVAMRELGRIYSEHYDIFGMAKKYLLMALGKEKTMATMILLGNLYKDNDNIEQAAYYYQMAIQHEISHIQSAADLIEAIDNITEICPRPFVNQLRQKCIIQTFSDDLRTYLDTHVASGGDELCPICHIEGQSMYAYCPVGHGFCLPCLVKLAHYQRQGHQCPICRTPIATECIQVFHT